MPEPITTKNSLVPPSKSDQVYDGLCALLFSRIWSGTETLNEVTLARTLGVSRTPVRNVLSRLGGEGLVQHQPGRGWFVTPLSIQDIHNIFNIKEVLESWAAAAATERLTDETHARWASSLKLLREAAQQGDVPAYCSADDHFHEVLFEIVNNPHLTHSLAQINRQWHRFRMGYVSQQGLLPVLFQEHLNIYDAVCSGDAKAAQAATMVHLKHVRSSLERITTRVLLPFMGANEQLEKVALPQ